MAGRPGIRTRRKQKARRKFSTWPPQWRSFRRARAFARSLGFTSSRQWHAYVRGDMWRTICELPEDIPRAPNCVYVLDWEGWGDWLGTGRTVAPMGKEFLPFKKARTLVRKVGLKSANEWKIWSRGDMPEKGSRPFNIPTNPDKYYIDKGWTSWGDFLGTGNLSARDMKWRSFVQARAYARSLGLRNANHWFEFAKKDKKGEISIPVDIPTHPESAYRNKGWSGWGDFLGTGNPGPKDRNWRSFEDARAFTHLLGLKNLNEWRLYCKGKLESRGEQPENIPNRPDLVYSKKGWISWGDWLGTGNIQPMKRKWRSFKAARDFVRSLELRNAKEWATWASGKMPEKGSRPIDIPSAPYQVYQDKGWTGWRDWLGTDPQRNNTSITHAERKAKRLRKKRKSSRRRWANKAKRG